MGYIKQNVNFILIFIALGLIVFVAGSAVFFNTNLQKVSTDLTVTEREINNLKGTLNVEVAKLSEIEETLELQEERETDLGSQYREVKASKDKLETDKNKLSSDIDKFEAQIERFQDDTAQCKEDRVDLREENDEIARENRRIEDETQSYDEQLDECQEG